MSTQCIDSARDVKYAENMKNQELSPKVLRALRILQRNLKKNEPKVLRMFAKAGRKPDPTLVLVFSMYYDTFRKLAMDD